jgi:hypothetical protein
MELPTPDDLKERMEEQETVNWSAVLRAHIREELDEREGRRLARAVATTERLRSRIDPATVADRNTAEVIREWRDRRYGPRE